MLYTAQLSKESLTFFDTNTGTLVFKCTFQRLRYQAELLGIKYSDYVRKCIDRLLNHFSAGRTAVAII